jgi:hypothetical protein
MKKIHIFDHDAYHQVLHHQIGNGIPVFAGYRQQGAGLGNIFGLIGRYILPLFAKHVLPHAKSAVLNTISDITKGKSLGDAMQTNSTSLLKNVGSSILRQTGQGLSSTNSVETRDLSSVVGEPSSMACHKKKRKRTSGKPKRETNKKPVKQNKVAKIQKIKKAPIRKAISKNDIFSKWR